MTADSDKEALHCLLCAGKVGGSTRNSYNVFGNDAVTSTDKPIISVLCSVIKSVINKEDAHSSVVCKKCYKLISEVSSLFLISISTMHYC